MTSVLHITWGHASKCVRARKHAQWCRAQGLDTSYLSIILNKKNPSGVCTLVEPLDGCKKFRLEVGAVGPNAVLDTVADLRPDIVHTHHFDALDRLCQSSILSDMWHFSPHDWPPPERPKKLCNTRLIASLAEYEGHRVLLRCTQRDCWSRGVREPYFAAMCDHIVAVTPALAQVIASWETGVPISTVLNSPCAPKHELDRTLLRKWAMVPDDTKIVLAVGQFSVPRLGHQLLKAVAHLGPQYRFVIMGDLSDFLEEDLRRLIGRVNGLILEPQPYNFPQTPPDMPTMLDWISGADVGFVGLLPDFENHAVALPNKFFEYAYSGVPCVASETSVDIKGYAKHYGTGLTYDNTTHDLEGKIVQACDISVDSARIIAETSWETADAELRRVYGIV